MDDELGRTAFQIAFIIAAYLIPLEFLGVGILDPKFAPFSWMPILLAVVSGFSMCWSIPLSEVLSRRLRS
jgi:hypothetical protein